jgi:hypothetical protein
MIGLLKSVQKIATKVVKRICYEVLFFIWLASPCNGEKHDRFLRFICLWFDDDSKRDCGRCIQFYECRKV